MTFDQEELVMALVLLQKAVYKSSFAENKGSFETLSYYFDRMVDSSRMAIGDAHIKEFLNERK